MDRLKEMSHWFMHYWKTSKFFREIVLFLVSIVAGAFLGAFYLIQGIVASSDWYYSLSVYYGFLTLIRIYLFNRKWVVHGETDTVSRDEISRRSMETTGILLALMNVALSVMIGEMVFFGHSKSYWVWMRYYIIVYTFFRGYSSLKTAYHGRRRHRIQRMIHIINLLDAIVGLFALTATMIDTYAHDSFMRTPILAISGLLIIGMLIFISDHMILASIRDEEGR